MRRYLTAALLLVPALARAQPSTEPPSEPPPAEPPPTPAEPLPPLEKPPGEAPPARSRAPAVVEPSPAAVDAAPRPTASGFAVETQLSTALTLAGSSSVLPLTEPGLFLGYRGPGITAGLGLALSRISKSSSLESGPSVEQSETSFLIMPGIRVPVARAADGRVELLGQVDAGFGLISDSGGDTGGSPSVHHFRFQIGPALRYWVAPAFAIGATTGVRYDALSVDQNGDSSSFSTTSLFTSFQLTGVF